PLTFKLTVDPARRNYVSVKLWGGEEPVTGQESDMGRLYLYVPASNFVAGVTNNYQVGYRHGGDYAPLNSAAWRPPLPGRFFYSTTLLPLWMTQGRTNLTLTIQPGGRIYSLGSGGPPSGNYQFNMITNSRGIYAAYTHTEAALNPAGETQGTAPATTIRTSPTVSTMNPGGSFYNSISNRFNTLLNDSLTNYSCEEVEILANCYWMTNFPTLNTNPAIVTKVIAAVDYFATNYYADPANSVKAGGNEGWGGRFGYLGWAIHTLSAQLQGSLDVVTNFGAGGTISRRQAWGDMLLASRNYGRFGRDGFYLSNQALLADRNIYWANRGLLDLTNVNAFAETNAQRYLLETVGIEPWRGSDLAGGGSSYLLGTNYYLVTPKGLTREWGYVGMSYGELSFHVANFYELTTNSAFLTQCVKMAKARSAFRRPSIDVGNGANDQAMEGIGLLAWRGTPESDSQYASEQGYVEKATMGMRSAAVTMDTNLIGYAKQQLSYNQYFGALPTTGGLSYEILKAFGDYQKVAAATDSGVRLPMTAGQPDFAWADEDSGIIAVKRGNERLWLSTYWQSTKATALNGIGRFLYETNNFARYGVLEVTPLFTWSGSFLYRANNVDSTYSDAYTPPDNLTNAYFGERIPQAVGDATGTPSEVFVGKANFWTCRYANFLIGINRSASASFELKTTSGFVSATNLITGQLMSGTVTVAPRSTVVLYLNSATDSSPVPMTPLCLNAVAGSAPGVALDWNPSSGALGYSLKRSLASGGPYTIIANVAGTNYTDTNVTFGSSYYYVVSGTNANGESAYNSMEASATPLPLMNPGFELPASGKISTGFDASSDVPSWSSGTMTDSGVEASSPHSGAYRAYFKNGDGAFWQTTSVTIVKGNSYTLTFYYLKSGGSGTPVIKVSLVAWNGTTETVLVTQSITSSTTTWSAGTNFVTVPDNTTDGQTLRIKFENTGTGNSSWAGVDDVALIVQGSLPGIPTALSAVAGDAQASLSWHSVSNATGYNLKRSTTSGSGYVTVTNLAGTNVVDTGLTNGTLYYFVVSALNASGEGTNSVETSARPVSFSPISLTSLLSGGQLQFNWPRDHLGWRLETQSNALTAGLGTNWFTVAGSVDTNQMLIPIGMNSDAVFFRLVYP
ncbi:MAG: hypothetical protein RLY20_620, partial [Verrucomicrobiota bacterium]